MLFGSVRIVEEVSRSTSTSAMNDNDPSPMPSSIEIMKPTIHFTVPPIIINYNNTKSKRRYYHGRKNSFYALKQLRKLNNKLTKKQQQISILKVYSTSIKHTKSQKLLYLWPLPIITRYTILLSFCLSLFCHFFDSAFQISCSSPIFVIYRSDIASLFLSPFLCNLASLTQIAIFGWNILLLGLFEESLTHMLGSTRRLVHVLLSILLSVSVLRQALGYLFSKSTGWAAPSLFFSDSLHECNQGLAPFLFALLVIQSLNMSDKYILMYGNNTDHQFTIRKLILQFIMCLVNYSTKNILWWSLSGLLTGFIATIVIQLWLAQDKRWDRSDERLVTSDKTESNTTTNDPRMLPSDMIQGKYRRSVSLWRTLYEAIKHSTLVLLIAIPCLLVCSAYYHIQQSQLVDPAILNQLSYDRYLFTFVIMTAPRRGDPPFLTRTLDSYLQNWPETNEEYGSLYNRVQTLIYTHFTTHVEYDRAKRYFESTKRGKQYLRWIREDGDQLDQRNHVSKALSLAADNYQSTYIALVEDDFPVCGAKEWRQIESVVYAANIESPNHCGIFVGTGGSGLFLKPKIAKLISRLLLKYTNLPPDIVIQQCLLGNLNECNECSQTLVTSKTLLMYHIGYNTSTSLDRYYKKNEFQCGWRHPFNGDPSVVTL
ncbi:MAG: hypothetical protein EXX96DRAFT_552955 [Benjaminiella poitrasii]|nr:MAG: hypothetical protein EXX96DRAFT_552955 [Benjaminiella poitrasii]